MPWGLVSEILPEARHMLTVLVELPEQRGMQPHNPGLFVCVVVLVADETQARHAIDIEAGGQQTGHRTQSRRRQQEESQVCGVGVVLFSERRMRRRGQAPYGVDGHPHRAPNTSS
jgi:hypothetical protein